MGRKKISSPNDSRFGKRIAELRKKYKLTMQALGDRVSLSKSYISLLESGVRQPSKDVVENLAQAFFPEGNDKVRDELLVLAGFRPVNLENYSSTQSHEAAYKLALEKNPKDFQAYLTWIQDLLKSQKYDIAKEIIQKGLQLFDELLQLQSLLANLELIKGNYSSAIQTQKSAIDSYLLQAENERPDVNIALFKFNLGNIYFTKAYMHLGNKHAAKNAQERSQESKEAFANFELARQQLKEAMELMPEHIYIIDEYARVNFNLAFLSENERQAAKFWKEAITSFKLVLKSEDKQELGYDVLKEAGIFLAHAYTKNKQFEEAEGALNLISAYAPNYWLLHYAKACFYNLKHESDKNETWLDRSLKSLTMAVSIEHKNNHARHQALSDPDLNAVRTQRKKQFKQIVG